jgi:CheY-like chemotaxis protein
MPEHATASVQSGADGHLTKPISAEALLRAVAEAATSGQPALSGERREAY